MGNTVYNINKGINKPIEFYGLRAQYIWWLGAGLVVLLIFFAALYIIGIHPFACLFIILSLGTLLFIKVHRLSRDYGEYGLMKEVAGRKLPGTIKVRSRRIFTTLKRTNHGKGIA